MFVQFVKEGHKKSKPRQSERGGILDQANDWTMSVDLQTRLSFQETVGGQALFMWSQKRKKVVAIEMTVPWEERCTKAHGRKKTKYEDLLAEYRQQG